MVGVQVTGPELQVHRCLPAPSTSHVTSLPSHWNSPRHPPSVHIVLLSKHPKVSPSVHAASECCFVSDTEHGPLGPGAAVHFMMGVVTTSGDAAIAHMLNSVRYSVSVMFASLPFPCAAWSPLPVCSMSISFQPQALPVYCAGIFATSPMMPFVFDHKPTWSPVARQDWAMGKPHFHGSSKPHSHIARLIGRPDAFNALLMSGYVSSGVMPSVLHQSILTQSTPHSAYISASCVQ
mmetsp:Transcript_144730/g.351487  ORF Transcript_144730/g.351487 Transcript_144730/m.351487 type:complete len:235 (-) Transcript_144730:98-802(-)